MAARHHDPETDGQLDLFASPRPTHETIDPYRRMAEIHWREHCPEDGARTERKGLLHQMLLEAEDKTKDEMAMLRAQLMKQGATPQQAHDQAWEMVREKYILLPPEE